VLANGFFVASEFSLVAVRKSRIEALAAEGSAAAKRLLDLLNNLNVYISATQLGITLASLGLGWVGEPAVAALLEPVLIRIGELTGATFLAAGAVLHTISFIIAFSFITFLHIVFGELAPKQPPLKFPKRFLYGARFLCRFFTKFFLIRFACSIGRERKPSGFSVCIRRANTVRAIRKMKFASLLSNPKKADILIKKKDSLSIAFSSFPKRPSEKR
jgi:CBS domain containing-hemolysin-like protein